MAQTVWNVTAGEMAVRLLNEEFVRPLGFGNNWVKIRLLMRIQILSTTNLPFATKLRVGVCKGTANTFRSVNTLNWLGIDFSGGNGVGWGYTSGFHYCGSPYSGYLPIKKIGNTITNGSGGGSSGYYVASTTSLYPTLWGFTVRRNFGGSFTCAALVPSNATMAGTLVDNYTFYRTLEDERGSTWAANYAPESSDTTNTGLQDDADCISIDWNDASVPIEITRMSIIRFR